MLISVAVQSDLAFWPLHSVPFPSCCKLNFFFPCVFFPFSVLTSYFATQLVFFPTHPYHFTFLFFSSRVHNVVCRCDTCLIIIFVFWIYFYIINTAIPSNPAGQSEYKKCNYWSRKSKTSKQIEQVNVLHLLNCVSEIGIYCFYLNFI